MGNDGGTIVKRLDIVRVKDDAAQSAVDPSILQRVRATTCALSRQPLCNPIVSDRVGHVFNKESVVKYLIRRAEGQKSLSSLSSSAEKTADDAVAGHVRGLKDVQTLRLTSNPAFTANVGSLLDEHDDEDMPAPFICPLNQREMNGRHRFLYLRPCGCVMSESGLRATVTFEKGADGEATCPNCATTFKREALGKKEVMLGGDVVVINGTEAEVEAMRSAMLAEREEEQRRKKEAKSKKSTDDTLQAVDREKARSRDEKRKRKEEKGSSGQSLGGSPDDERRNGSKRAKGSSLEDDRSRRKHLSTAA